MKEVPIVTLGNSVDEEDSILSSQYSDKHLDSAWIRKYSIRKLKKLVDKCCKKCIHFPKKFCEISKRLAKDPDLITDNEIIELRTECFESLNNMGCMSESNSSSSDSSSEKIPKKKKRSTNTGLLVNSPPELDPTNPYNVAYSYHGYPEMSYRGTPSVRLYHGRHSQFCFGAPTVYHYSEACPYSRLAYGGYENPPLASQQQQSSDRYSLHPVEHHLEGHPQLHMQAQPQHHVQRHLQPQIPSHPQLDIQVHPQRHMQAQPKHHIQGYPEHEVTDQNVYEQDKSPEPTSWRNVSLDSFAQVFSKALPTYQTVQEMTPVQISNPSTPVSETLYSDKSTNVSPDNTIESTQSEQVS